MIGGPGGVVQVAPPAPVAPTLGSWLWHQLATVPANRQAVAAVAGRSAEDRIKNDKARAGVLAALFEAGLRPNLSVLTNRYDVLHSGCSDDMRAVDNGKGKPKPP